MYRQTHIPRLQASLWVSIGQTPGESLIVPDGCMDLIRIGPTIIIAGADSTARGFAGTPEPVIGLRFGPGVLPQLLATSAAELADRVTPLEAVVAPGIVAAAQARAAGIDEPGSPRRRAGEAAAEPMSAHARELLAIATVLTDRTVFDRRPMDMAGLLGAGMASPARTVAEVAADFAYSPRQLRRLSAEWFGYGPKHLTKVLRWQAARAFLAAGHTRTAAAARAGYADAAHLWRDERSLLGR